MKKLLSAACALLLGLVVVSPAFAQVAYTDVDPSSGARITVPVTPSKPLPVTGGGGGSAGATAAAAGTVAVTAGTGKPQAIDLFSSTAILAKDNTGAYLPLATAALQGVQGTGSTYNPPSGGSGQMGYLSGLYAAAIDTTPVAVTGSGTAGTPAAGVVTVQGASSMTALKVDGSGVTQPVSGTVTANAGTGTMAVSAASLPLPTGAMGATGGTVGLVAGSAVIGHVIVDTAPTTAVTIATAPVLVAGSAIIGKFGIDQTTPGTTNAVAVASITSGGATPYHYVSTAATNSTLISTGAHTLYSLSMTGLNATAGYVRLYDQSAAPTCSSATGAIHTYLVIGSATAQGGLVVILPAQGEAVTSGLGFCITGGSADNDNTSGPAGVIVNATYK